jgi:hypothetical protein
MRRNCLGMIRWERDPRVIWRRTGERRLLCNDAGELHIIEQTGSVTWDVLERPLEEHTLLTILARKYDVPSSEIREQVQVFLTELEASGLVRRA